MRKKTPSAGFYGAVDELTIWEVGFFPRLG
jgi:hypothetical protein